MDTESRNNFLHRLSNIIDDYADNYNLFNGGCCYAAAVIAKALETLRINYDVRLFQYNEIIQEVDFNSAINGNCIAHVAIAVEMNEEWRTIGDCEGVYNFFEDSGYPYSVKQYKNITPEQLLEGYMENRWNSCYDTRLNKFLSKDINNLVDAFLF